MNDTDQYPERLAYATEAYFARERVRYSDADPLAERDHYLARRQAARAEYFIHPANPREPYDCCKRIHGLAQIHRHVAGYRHIATVFGISEQALREYVRDERARMAREAVEV